MEPETLLLFACGFLIAAAAVYRFTRSIRIPGVTIMMLLGAVSVVIPFVNNELDEIYNFTVNKLPELILLVFLPILIFESGRKLRLREIRSEIVPILFFSVVGVVITIFIVALGISLVLHTNLMDGILFGTIVASTDAVAVAIIFKRFTIPKRLNLIIEGESLFNDATSLVSFNLVIGIMFSNEAFSLASTSLSFIWSMMGAVALGSVLGYVGGKVLNRWHGDEHVNFTFSIALAIGGFLIADHYLHISGVVTTLFTALFLVRTHKDMFSQVRAAFHKYWDYTGFMTNSFLFFLIGIPLVYEFQSFDGISLVAIILAPITIVIISRAITVYGGCVILRLVRIRIPRQWQNILTLGGLRGGIAVAMVLSLPVDYEFKNLFIASVISVVVINLVILPILLDSYLKRTKLVNEKTS
ncbi:MAG TPA: sodium:proton antiporter [Nitrososphaeraceae archaeon]|jgi:CPA1 family monovalent cation:H+ antiporter